MRSENYAETTKNLPDHMCCAATRKMENARGFPYLFSGVCDLCREKRLPSVSWPPFCRIFRLWGTPLFRDISRDFAIFNTILQYFCVLAGGMAYIQVGLPFLLYIYIALWGPHYFALFLRFNKNGLLQPEYNIT
eukprot:GEMP01079989.1.p1 GENE.GEMP01079989.1~~GEMP01079989.1.p1  ORF type:complete len:134 (+),score=1.59 GEMP01079989.1:219-620(+)